MNEYEVRTCSGHKTWWNGKLREGIKLVQTLTKNAKEITVDSKFNEPLLMKVDHQKITALLNMSPLVPIVLYVWTVLPVSINTLPVLSTMLFWLNFLLSPSLLPINLPLFFMCPRPARFLPSRTGISRLCYTARGGSEDRKVADGSTHTENQIIHGE